MKKLWFAGFIVAFGVCGLPNRAAALTCADASVGTNQYTVTGTGTTTATDCVADNSAPGGNNNLNGTASDDFLNGPNDDATQGGTYLGGGWTSFCSSESGASISCADAYNFAFTGGNGGTSGTFSFDGLLGKTYAIGVKDGSAPFWAVFLLSNSDTTNPVSYSGTWSILNGGLSHFVIYDKGVATNVQPETPVPEPASLLLLGSGLALAGQRFRRRRQAQAV